jgi:hypothetical protein
MPTWNPRSTKPSGGGTQKKPASSSTPKTTNPRAPSNRTTEALLKAEEERKRKLAEAQRKRGQSVPSTPITSTPTPAETNPYGNVPKPAVPAVLAREQQVNISGEKKVREMEAKGFISPGYVDYTGKSASEIIADYRRKYSEWERDQELKAKWDADFEARQQARLGSQENKAAYQNFKLGRSWNKYFGDSKDAMYKADPDAGDILNATSFDPRSVSGYDPELLEQAVATDEEYENYYLSQQDDTNQFIKAKPVDLIEFGGVYWNAERFVAAFAKSLPGGGKSLEDIVSMWDDLYREEGSYKMYRMVKPGVGWDSTINKGVYGVDYLDKPMSEEAREYLASLNPDDDVQYRYENEKEILYSSDPNKFYWWTAFRGINLDPNEPDFAIRMAEAIAAYNNALQSLDWTPKKIQDTVDIINDRLGKSELMSGDEVRRAYEKGNLSESWMETIRSGSVTLNSYDQYQVRLKKPKEKLTEDELKEMASKFSEFDFESTDPNSFADRIYQLCRSQNIGDVGNTFVDMLGDFVRYYITPMREQDMGRLAWNVMQNAMETVDIAHRPISAVLIAGMEEDQAYYALRAEGLSQEEAYAEMPRLKSKYFGMATGENGVYTNRYFDTGNLATDIILEIFTDPLFLTDIPYMLVKGAASAGVRATFKTVGKAALKETITESPMFYIKMAGSEADTVARIGNRFAKMPSEKTILKIALKNKQAYINEGPDAFRNAFMRDLKVHFKGVRIDPDNKLFNEFADRIAYSDELATKLKAVATADGMDKVFKAKQTIDEVVLFNSALPLVGTAFAIPAMRKVLSYGGRRALMAIKSSTFRNAVRVAQDGTVKFMDEIADLRKAETYELNEEWWILNKLNKLGSPGQLKSVAEAELRKGALLDIRNIRAIIFEDDMFAGNEINAYLKNVTGHDLEEYIELIEKYARAYPGKFDDILKEFKGFRNPVEYKDKVTKLAREAKRQKAELEKLKKAQESKDAKAFIESIRPKDKVATKEEWQQHWQETYGAMYKRMRVEKARIRMSKKVEAEFNAFVRDYYATAKALNSEIDEALLEADAFDAFARNKAAERTELKKAKAKVDDDLDAFVRDYEAERARINKKINEGLDAFTKDYLARLKYVEKEIEDVLLIGDSFDAQRRNLYDAVKQYRKLPRDATSREILDIANKHHIDVGTMVYWAREIENSDLAKLNKKNFDAFYEDSVEQFKVEFKELYESGAEEAYEREILDELEKFKKEAKDEHLHDIHAGNDERVVQASSEHLGNFDGRLLETNAFRARILNKGVSRTLRKQLKRNNTLGALLKPKSYKRLRDKYEWVKDENLYNPASDGGELQYVIDTYSHSGHPVFVYIDPSYNNGSAEFVTIELKNSNQPDISALIVRLTPDSIRDLKESNAITLLHEIGHHIYHLLDPTIKAALKQELRSVRAWSTKFNRFQSSYGVVAGRYTEDRYYSEMFADAYANYIRRVESKRYNWHTLMDLTSRKLDPDVLDVFDKYIIDVLASNMHNKLNNFASLQQAEMRFKNTFKKILQKDFRDLETRHRSLDNQDVMGADARDHLSKLLKKTGGSIDDKIDAAKRILKPFQSKDSLPTMVIRDKETGARQVRQELQKWHIQLGNQNENFHWKMYTKVLNFLNLNPETTIATEYLASFYQAQQYVKLAKDLNGFRKGYKKSMDRLGNLLNKLAPVSEYNRAARELAETVKVSVQVDDAFAQVRLLFHGKSGNIIDMLNSENDAVATAVRRLVEQSDGINADDFPTQLRHAAWAARDINRAMTNLNAYKDLLRDLSDSVNSERLYYALVSEFQRRADDGKEMFYNYGYRKMVDRALGSDSIIVEDLQTSFVSYRNRISEFEGLTDEEKAIAANGESPTFSNALLIKGVHHTDDMAPMSRMPKATDDEYSFYYTDFMYTKDGAGDDLLEMSIIPKSSQPGDTPLEIRRVYSEEEMDVLVKELTDSKLRIMFPKASTKEERIALFRERHTATGEGTAVAPDGHDIQFVRSDTEFLDALEGKALWAKPVFISNNGTRTGFLELMKRGDASGHGLTRWPKLYGKTTNSSLKFDIMRERTLGTKDYAPSIDEIYRIDSAFETYSQKINGYTVMPSSVRDLNQGLRRLSQALRGDLSKLIDGYANDLTDSLKEISDLNNAAKLFMYDDFTRQGYKGRFYEEFVERFGVEPDERMMLAFAMNPKAKTVEEVLAVANTLPAHTSMRRLVKGQDIMSPVDIRIRHDLAAIGDYFTPPDNATIAELNDFTQLSRLIGRRVSFFSKDTVYLPNADLIRHAAADLFELIVKAEDDNPLRFFRVGETVEGDLAFLELRVRQVRSMRLKFEEACTLLSDEGVPIKLFTNGKDWINPYRYDPYKFDIKEYYKKHTDDMLALDDIMQKMHNRSSSLHSVNLALDIEGFTDARKYALSRLQHDIDEIYMMKFGTRENGSRELAEAIEQDAQDHLRLRYMEATWWWRQAAKSIDFIEHSLLWDYPLRIFDGAAIKKNAEFLSVMKFEEELSARGIALHVDPATNLIFVYFREDAGIKWVEGKLHGRKITYPVTNYSGERVFKSPPKYEHLLDDEEFIELRLEKQLEYLTEGRSVGAHNGVLSKKKIEAYVTILPKEVREAMGTIIDEYDINAVGGIMMDRIAPYLVKEKEIWIKTADEGWLQEIDHVDFKERLPFYQPPGMFAQRVDTFNAVMDQTQNGYLFINTWFGEQQRFTLKDFVQRMRGKDKKEILQGVQELQDAGYVFVIGLKDKTPLGFRFDTMSVKHWFELEKAIEMGAVPMPFPVYHQMFMDVNTHTFSNPVLKVFQKLNTAFKVGVLMNPFTALRNYLDEGLKNMIETEDPMGVMSTSIEAANLQVRYYSTLRLINQAYGDIPLDEVAIRDIFEILPAHEMPLTYNEFMLIRAFMTDAGNVQDEFRFFDKARKGTVDVLDGWSKMNNALLKPMNWGDQNARLTQFIMLMRSGGSTTDAFHQIAKTHFDYSLKSRATMLIELLIPFWNFTKMNTFYWMELMTRKPWVGLMAARLERTMWNPNRVDQEELSENLSLQNVMLNGNILINDTISLKFNPSLFNMYNVLFNTVETMEQQTSMYLKTALAIFLEDKGISSEQFQGDLARNIVYTLEGSDPTGPTGEFIKENPWIKTIPYIGQWVSQASYAETAKTRNEYPNLYNALTIGGIGAVKRWQNFVNRGYIRQRYPDNSRTKSSFNKAYFEYLYGENGLFDFNSWKKRQWHNWYSWDWRNTWKTFHYNYNYWRNYYDVNHQPIFRNKRATPAWWHRRFFTSHSRPKKVYTEFYSDFYGKTGNWKMKSRMQRVSKKNIAQRAKDMYYYWKDLPQYRPRR